MDRMGIVGAILCLIGMGMLFKAFTDPRMVGMLYDLELWTRAKFPRLSAYFPPCDCIDVCHCKDSELDHLC